MTESLGDDLHIWLCNVDKFRDSSVLDRCVPWLDDVETQRWKRFRFERDRHLFLVAHALVRHSLSRYANVPPGAWRFAVGKYGRPEISGADAKGLRFNLSHARGLAAVLINRGIDCGIDVEPRHRDVDTLAVSKRVFADAERADMLTLPTSEQRARFFEYWTLKESYIKARGMGLALPLAHFAFTIGNPITVGFDASMEDDPSLWQFELHSPTSDHQLAWAARRGHGPERRVRMRWVDSW